MNCQDQIEKLEGMFQYSERLRLQLEKENAAANKRIEELFKEKQELERKYNLLRYGSED